MDVGLKGGMQLLPALQRPTISSLSDQDWVAVNTIIEEKTVRALIPKLKAANARLDEVSRPLAEHAMDQVMEAMLRQRGVPTT